MPATSSTGCRSCAPTSARSSRPAARPRAPPTTSMPRSRRTSAPPPNPHDDPRPTMKDLKHSLEFGTQDAVALAQFIAELVRQAVTYEVTTLCGGGWRVYLTGGY